MEAIILAGGFGTRLRPLTYSKAKPLLPILNKPMVSYLIEMLPKEVTKVILAVNYKKNQIEEYLNKTNFNKEIIVNDEPEPLGTGGAVKFAEKHITDTFFVLNSDIICSLDLKKMLNFHKEKQAKATISLWPVKNVEEFGVADVEDNGKIIGFVEKPKHEDAPSDLINAGAYIIEPEILEYIKPNELISMEKKIFPRIIEDTDAFYGYKFKGYWMDIGRISSYLNIHQFLIEKKNLKNYTGENNKIFGEITKCCLASNIFIGKNSKLDSVIVYDNAKIGENVIINNSVIGENCEIDNFCKINNSVIGDNERVKTNTVLENKPVWNQPKPEGYPDKQIGNVIGE